jgi:predicted membrane protein
MRNKSQLVLGGGVLLFGLLLLISNLFDFDLWRFFWPLALISIGVFVIFRQTKTRDETMAYFGFARDINRYTEWEIQDAEYWNFVADFDLDLSQASFPEGEAHWKAFGFVNELRLKIPSHIGAAVTTHAFFTERRIDGNKEDLILIPMDWQSDNFETAGEKLFIELNGFFNEVRITQTSETNIAED